jgi:hypothetical protein
LGGDFRHQLHDVGRLHQRRGAPALLVTLVFGTIHGFSFAANLLEMKLPAGRLRSCWWFQCRVEIGQLAVVA